MTYAAWLPIVSREREVAASLSVRRGRIEFFFNSFRAAELDRRHADGPGSDRFNAGATETGSRRC